MAASETDIYNLALNAVGARNTVSSPTEVSVEAQTCHLWYDIIRTSILEAAPWPEATKFAYPAEIAAATGTTWAAGDPAPGFDYVYGWPGDCLRPQHMSDFAPFIVTGYDGAQRVIHCNTYQALLKYTFDQTTVTLWGKQLQMAVVYGLAANICMPLTGKATRARMLLQSANANILEAREAAGNTNDMKYDPLPDWISARGFDNENDPARYIYPYGSLLALTTS